MKTIFKSRFALLLSFMLFYITASFIVRMSLYFMTIRNIGFSVFSIPEIVSVGLYFDIGVAIFFSLFYCLYLLAFPRQWIGTIADKVITFFILSVMLLISIFSFIAEFPFWEEFSTRFNFIAVDYLIYTYEVVENINESYPLPLIFAVLFILTFGIFFFLYKVKIFHYTFTVKPNFLKRSIFIAPFILLSIFYTSFVQNKQAECTNNAYINELSKNGVFSFFAAYRSNELDYEKFYPLIDKKEAYGIIKKELKQGEQNYTGNEYDNIERLIPGDNAEKPNIILIVIESFSARFLKTFGNKYNLTPNFEKIANESVFFTNLFATGTRTVRGMEALALCVPPTPGQSIVRRPGNDNLFSIGTILKEKDYTLKFLYGGDGYFDNMNAFFGGQGFDIVDRNRGNPLSDNIKTKRYNIDDNDVSFENAWGVCDEDLYKQSLKYADSDFGENKQFFQLIMTTSNHKPYTFPKGKINLPQGKRNSAVKYTDYALGKFIDEAKTKPWFSNTVFVIVADHCASSAGKWGLNIDKHHIPAIIYNLKNTPNTKIAGLCSQTDLMPTLFGYLNWKYKSQFYGLNINKFDKNSERAFIGNYRTLGLLKNGIFTEINDRKEVKQYRWNAGNKVRIEISTPVDSLKNLAISYFQTASERFKNGKMKVKGRHSAGG